MRAGARTRSEWTLRLSPSRFSDGNQRWALGLDGRERIHTTPHLKTDLTLELSSQRNSLDAERPYFNPRSDLMVLPGLRLTHALHRRYENAWEQIGTLGAGAYTQQGYGTGGVIALGYGQRYRANDVLDMGAMVTGISRPYDGRRERELRITFDLAYRFCPAALRAPLKGRRGGPANRLRAAPTSAMCHGELNCLNRFPDCCSGPAIAGHAAPGRLRQGYPRLRRARRAAGGPIDQPWVQGHFLTLAYHDVEDEDPDQGFLSVRTDRLVDQLNWLRENGYQAVSVDQILAARQPGGKPLPERAVLLTFDDGYRSFLTRVLPILKAYGWPAVLAPVGTWMDTPADRKVDFGGNMQPRDRFLDWNDVREISRSGLVEIAAHTDASHGALANPRAIPSRPPPCASTTRAMAATRTRPASSNAWAATWPRSAKRSAAPPASAARLGLALWRRGRHHAAHRRRTGLSDGADAGRRPQPRGAAHVHAAHAAGQRPHDPALRQ